LKTKLPHIHYYAEVVNAIGQPIVILDEAFEIITSNKSFCRISGFAENTENNFFTVASNSEDEQYLKANIEQSISDGGEFEYTPPGDPDRRYMLSAKDLDPDKNSVHLKVLSFRDITLEKIGEERRDDFISVASHELKTPLAIISALSQILEREATKCDTPAFKVYASKINSQSKKLLSLASALLDISQIHTGKFTLKMKWFNINELIEEITEDFSFTHKTHKILVSGESSASIYADREMISQVLSNLISNAIKYSPDAKEINIHIDRDDKGVLVSVKDFGIGIPEKEQCKLFQRFSRTDIVNEHNIPGSGLGLYICFEIIRKHAGRLWMESKKDSGSTFYFSLPDYNT
jgi:signal transduction histidine kinase